MAKLANLAGKIKNGCQYSIPPVIKSPVFIALLLTM